jgi:hypothetical protein
VLGQRLQQDILQRRRHRSGAAEGGEQRRHRITGRFGEQVGEPERLECLCEFGSVERLGQFAERHRHQGALCGVDNEGLRHALLGNPSSRDATMSF